MNQMEVRSEQIKQSLSVKLQLAVESVKIQQARQPTETEFEVDNPTSVKEVAEVIMHDPSNYASAMDLLSDFARNDPNMTHLTEMLEEPDAIHNTQESQSLIFDHSKLKTELQTHPCKTVHKIVEGFWMKGDFCVFITFDRVHQHYYLELFNKTQDGLLDTVQIAEAHEMITFYVEKSFDQSYTAILCEYQNQLTSRSCKLQLFVLKSEGFRNGKIKDGLRSLDENDCLLLSNGENSTTGSHLMLFSQCDDSLKILYQHEKKLEGKKKVMVVMTQLNIGILYTPGSEVVEAITSPRINSKVGQRKKKMIGFFYSHWHQIFVYQDGFIQMLKMRKMEIYSSELVLPFKNAEKCFFTKIQARNDSPVLIFESKKNQVQAYLFDKNDHIWKKYFGFDQNAFEIQKAYGSYLIVKSMKDRRVKLLELGGVNDNQVVTEMDLGIGPQPYLRVESCAQNQTLAVFYERHSNKFYWRWFDSHRQMFHFANKTVNQVCGNLLIQIKLGGRSNKLTVIDLNTYEQDTRAQLFSICLPESHSQISTFYPAMSPCSNYIALAISFELGTALEFHNNKYQDVVILSLKEKLPIQVPSMRKPFSRIFFRSSQEILCQNDGGLISIHIEKMVSGKNDNDSDLVSDDDYGSLEFEGSPTKLEKTRSWLSDHKSKLLPSQTLIKSANYNVGCNFQRLKFECRSSKLIHVEQDFMLVLNGLKRAIYRVNFDAVAVVDVTESFRRSTLKQPSFTPEEIILNDVCTLKMPGLPDTAQKVWDTCFSEDMNTMYVLLSTWNLSWVYKYIKDQGSYHLAYENFFTVKHAIQIFQINDEQLGIQTIDGMAVVNLTTRQVDFKFFFIEKMNVEVTTSRGYVCVPRIRNGVMFKIGSNFSDCLQMHVSRQDDNQFPSLNCIKNRCELEKGYYLNIDEERVDWSSRHKFLPITLMSPDHVLQENGLPTSYNHMEIFFVIYSTDFNIFDSVIRDGLMTGKVEISNDQLNRICNPVLADKNRNLLFHLVKNHGSKSLIKLFEKTSIADYFNLRTKRFAFFRDFDKLTVFDTALDNQDFQSFNILLNQLLIQQNGFQSNYYVGLWILKAMKHDLDLKTLFQSQICTMKITSEIPNFAQYPPSHHKCDTMTECLDRDFPFTQIFRSNEIYDKMFGKEFGEADKTKEKVSIQYHLDLLFINNKEAFIELLELLAKTNNMSYLSTEYIQRFVDYNWDKAKFYFITIFAFHTVSFSMIIITACLLNSSGGSPKYEARWAVNYANMILVFGFLAIEVKQMIAQRIAYFKDALNYNDLFFIFSFYTTMIFDWRFGAVAFQGTAEITRICYVVLTISSFVKFLSLAQVFDSFGFIVKMVREVIIQIQPFMGLFLIFLVFFAVSVSVQNLQYDPALEGSGLTAETITAAESQNPFYGMNYINNGLYLTMTSLGSYNVDLFKNKHEASRDLMWGIWLLIVLIQTIVFMNFLVAVIGDVYAKTIQHKTELVFQKKAQLVVEFEYMKSKDQRLKNTDQFLFLTRKSFLTADSDSQAWQGSLSELKKLLIYQQQQIKIQVQQIFKFSFRNSETQMQEIKQGVSQLNTKFDQILKMHSQLEQIRVLVEAAPNLDADKILSEIKHEWNDSFKKILTFRSSAVCDNETDQEDESVMLARQLTLKARQQAKSLPRQQVNSLSALFK